MNRKLKIIVYVILSLGLVGIGFMSISNIFNKEEPKQTENEKGSEHKNINYHVYASYDETKKLTSLYKLDEELNEELLVDNAIKGTYAYSVFKNYLYYFDASGILHRYNLKTKENITLNMKVTNINFGYEMKAYEHYLVMIYSNGFYLYDIDNDRSEKLDLSVKNYSFAFNEERKELYYIPKNNVLYSYNIETKDNKLFMHDARPLIVHDGKLYFSDLANKKYYTYTFANKETNSITYIDYVLTNYDTNKSYISQENKIREVTKDKEETICTIEDIFLIDKMVVLEKYILLSGMYDEGNEKCYIFDIDKRKLREVTDEEFSKYYAVIDTLYTRYIN